jgi:hypothetical protein
MLALFIFGYVTSNQIYNFWTGRWLLPAGECARREANGHDSGMGEIFRRAAAVSPIKPLPVRRLRSS